MKPFLPLTAALVLGSLAATVQGQQLEPKDDLPWAPQGKTWKLVWHDEFAGTKLDTTKWDIPECKRRDGYWSRKAISLDGKGHLVMSVLKEGDKYVTARVNRLAAVFRIRTQFPFRERDQKWVNPKKSNFPGPPASGLFRAPGGLRNGTSRVLSGWIVRPYLPKRFGSTAITRRASSSSVNPITSRVAQGNRTLRPSRNRT